MVEGVAAVQPQGLQIGLGRRIFPAALGADPPHQPLGDDAPQGARNQIGLHADVQQAVDGGGGVAGVDGGEDQVAGDGGPHGDAGGLAVPDLAHGDDVRVLAEDGAQALGEGHARLLVDLHLADAVQVVLHRVLQGDQIHLLGVELAEHGVHGGGFARAGGAHNEEDAALGGHELIVLGEVQSGKAQGGGIQKLDVLVQQADDEFFPVDGGEGGHAQVHLAVADGDVGPPVLGDLPLGDVHAAHDLQPGDDRGLQALGHGEDVAQQAVNPHPDPYLALLGLQVNIAGPLHHGALNDGVDQPHGGGGLYVAVENADAADGGRVAVTGLPLHVLNGPGRALVAVEGHNGPGHRLAGGDHGHHPLAGGGFDLLHGDEVQRVAHGQIDGVAVHADRDHVVLPGDVFGEHLRHLRRGDGLGEVDELNAQLELQRLDKLLLGDKAVFRQNVAQALFGALLQRERAVQLLMADKADIHQQITQAFVCHVRSSLPGRLPVTSIKAKNQIFF